MTREFNRSRPDVDVDGATLEASTVEAIGAYTRSEAFDGDAYVAPSTIREAGDGLFARRRLESGAILRGVTYGGDVLTLGEAMKMDERKKDYVMAMHFNVHVDARAHLGYLGRFANDARGTGAEPNATFVKDVPSRSARLKTLRTVERGEELLVSYGDGYWRARERQQ